MPKLPFKREPLSEQLANMNKLGKTYLKAIDIDIDQVNICLWRQSALLSGLSWKLKQKHVSVISLL